MANMQVRIFDELHPNDELGRSWECLVANNPTSGFMQSLTWAAAKRAQGLKSFHLGLFEDEKLIGGAIFYTAKDNKGAGLLVAPEGPILPWEHEARASEGLGLLMRTAKENAKDLGIMAVRIEPRLEMPVSSVLKEFGRAPVDLIPHNTLYLDLNMSEQELLGQMKQKGRYNIGLAAKHGVVVVEDRSLEALKKFYPIISEAASRDDFTVEPLSFFQSVVEKLCSPKSDSLDMARFLFAEHEGDILAAMLLVTYGNRSTYLYGGIRNIKRNMMAGYALQWEAIKASRQAGCGIYDFYGFDQFQEPGHGYARFSRFKSAFGGQAQRWIGAHDHFYLDLLADVVVKAAGEVEQSQSLVSTDASAFTVNPNEAESVQSLLIPAAYNQPVLV